MDIEKEIFKRRIIDFKKLENYGFHKEKDNYIYERKLIDGFKTKIFIDKTGLVSGKIYDLMMEEEYINFRIESQNGKFVNQIRMEYEKVLTDIAKNCSESLFFVLPQSNRITRKIIEKYQDEPDFAWEKSPEHGIFRNPSNKKWYGLIMNIDKSKLDKSLSGEIEVINVKLEEEVIPTLIKKDGFYPAYHMNKKNWITIVLDDTLSDDEIMNYITESHKFTEKIDEWIVPANPKFYDVIHCFDDVDTILWKHSSRIKVGDIIYLYVASPYSAILYKCEAIEVDIPYEYKDKDLSISHVMKIKLLEKYNQNQYTFTKLNEYGIKAIRGPRTITEKLRKEMNQES